METRRLKNRGGGQIVSSFPDLERQLQGLLDARIAELAAGDHQCATLRTAIAALTGVVPAAPKVSTPVRLSKPLEQAPPPSRRARPKTGDLAEQLLELLTPGPQAFRDLKTATGVTPGTVKRALMTLAEEARAHCVGWSSAARWHLGPKPATPAKEAVQGRRRGA